MSFRPGPDPWSLSMNGTTVYLVAQEEVKEYSLLWLSYSSPSPMDFTILNVSQNYLLLSISIVIILVQFTIISFLNDNISSFWSTCILTSLLTYILSSTLQLEWLFSPLPKDKSAHVICVLGIFQWFFILYRTESEIHPLYHFVLDSAGQCFSKCCLRMHQHHTGVCFKMQSLGTTPYLIYQKLWGWYPADFVLKSPPDDFDVYTQVWKPLL